jgi:hypothetical protein
MEMMAMDVLGPLPVTDRGMKYILVVMDFFSKWPEVFALEDQQADSIVKCLLEVISRHGAMKILLSDQGSNFESQKVKDLCELYGIDKRRTSPYHPMCDGMVERFNRTLLSMLSMYVDQNHHDWDKWLSQVVFAYRTSVHSTTGVSPFEIIHGRKAVLPIDIQFRCEINDTNNDYYGNLQSQLDIIKAKVQKNTESAKKVQKKQYDKKLSFKPFKIGDRVRMYQPTIRKGMTKKFVRPWVGPFVVAIKTSDVNYRLKDGDGRVSKVIHYNRLQLCKSEKLKVKRVSKLTKDTQEEFVEPDDENVPAITLSKNTTAVVLSPLKLAPILVPTVKTLPVINEEIAASEEAEVKQEGTVAAKKESGMESQGESEDNVSVGEDDDTDVDENSTEEQDEENEEMPDDTSGEENDNENESEDDDDKSLELAAQARVAWASEVVPGIPTSRRSTRLSVPPE